MESGNDQTVEAVAEQPEGIGLADRTPAAVDRELLVRLVRKRLEKFVSLVPVVLVSEEPESVHDARVCSRRLQQALTVLFPQPRPRRVRRLERTLRRVRRALGEWRNCDVALELVARERRKTRSQSKRRAWELVTEYLRERRARQMALARQKVLRYDLPDFASRVQKLLDEPAGAKDGEAVGAVLRAGAETAWTRWQSTLAVAQETRDADDIHGFRIASKRLRYRIELLNDLGNKDVWTLIQWLKALQEAVGLWHDRQTLFQVTAECLARREFLLRETKAARTLLAELEKDRVDQRKVVEEIFRLAGKLPERQHVATSAEA